MWSFDTTCPVFVRVFDECSVVFVFVGLDAVSLFQLPRKRSRQKQKPQASCNAWTDGKVPAAQIISLGLPSIPISSVGSRTFHVFCAPCFNFLGRLATAGSPNETLAWSEMAKQ